MRLDLSGAGWSENELPPDLLESVSREARRPFVDLVTKLGSDRGFDIDWWVTPLATRNTYACPLYLRLCRLVLAIRLARTRKIDEIVVDSPALARILSPMLGNTVRVTVAGGAWRTHLSRALGVLRRYSGSLYHVACQFLFSRLDVHGKAGFPAKPLILVDTFLYADSVVGKQLRDRHYPGMLEHLSPSERAQVYFAPSYYGVYNYLGFFRKLRKCGANLLLKEDVLRPGDYLFALCHPFRLSWPKGVCKFLDMDVGPLVREALTESFAGSGSIEALLRYRFAKRLREKGVRLQRIIEWFENQEVDHGANAGWRTFYPDTLVIGYQGYLVSRHYLCVFRPSPRPTNGSCQIAWHGAGAG